MIWSSMAQKWPIIVIFCGMDNQKSKFLLIHGIFSVRGCWGQSRLLFWKLDDESQISKTQDHTDTFKHNLTSIFLSVRPKLLLTFQYEIPCIIFYLLKGIFDRLGDEFLTRHSLKTQLAAPQDEDIPHPLKVHNFAAGIDVGQISGKEMNYLHRSIFFRACDLNKSERGFGPKPKIGIL